MATKSLYNLVNEFNKLPGIGKKTAQRLAFSILEMDEEDVISFAKSMVNVKRTVKKCLICGNYSEEDNCIICNNINRDGKTICVVEDSKDVTAMERANSYNGVYHVLHGKISPLDGISGDKLNIKSLIGRVATGDIEEVILALNPDLEGDTTSLYIAQLLKGFDVKVSKIASGIPMGGNIEFADMATISRSLQGRVRLGG